VLLVDLTVHIDWTIFVLVILQYNVGFNGHRGTVFPCLCAV